MLKAHALITILFYFNCDGENCQPYNLACPLEHTYPRVWQEEGWVLARCEGVTYWCEGEFDGRYMLCDHVPIGVVSKTGFE